MKISLFLFFISLIKISNEKCILQTGESVSQFSECYSRILSNEEKGESCCFFKTKGSGEINGISVNGEIISCVPGFMGKEQQYMDSLLSQKSFSNIEIQCSDYGVLTGRHFYLKYNFIYILIMIFWVL